MPSGSSLAGRKIPVLSSVRTEGEGRGSFCHTSREHNAGEQKQVNLGALIKQDWGNLSWNHVCGTCEGRLTFTEHHVNDNYPVSQYLIFQWKIYFVFKVLFLNCGFQAQAFGI